MQHTHYDITKRTIEKLPDINELVRNQSMSFEERYREMRIKLFGRETVEMIERANEKWAEEHPEEADHTQPDYDEKDLLPPMTPEEQQAADAEAINVMMGRNPGQPDTSDQTHPL
jgi:hypothetical protein